eukprot:gene40271-49070_t
MAATDLPTEFCVHDNGGRPFKVTLRDGNSVDVQVQSSFNPQTNSAEYSAWASFSYENIFVGKGEYHVVNDEPRSFGNSVLLQVEDLTYVLIGMTVAKFTAFDPIVKFVGTVCNSDVVYAFAVDKKGRHYFFDHPFRYLDIVPEANAANPYNYFYSRDGGNLSKEFASTVLHDRVLL